MLRFLVLAPIVLLTVPAHAEDRTYSVSSFERIRIDGPFKVELTLGKAPSGKAVGDTRSTDRLDLRVEGDTLIVRAGTGAWEEQAAAKKPSHSPTATVIRVSTLNLNGATVIGGGQLTIAGPMRGQRITLTLTGSGSLTASGLAADQLIASVTGSGTLTLAGKAARARLSANGTTRIVADKLVADDLNLRTDGNGETTARARYTANINATGVGAVAVYGTATCVVNKNVQGPVSCGAAAGP